MSVCIDLTESYRLTSDPRQWKIEKRNENGKTGEITWEPIAYHGSPEQSLTYARERLLRECNATTFDALLAEANRIAEVISIKGMMI